MSIKAYIWNAALIFGCAYLVFWRGQSGWWFLLALILLVGNWESDGAREEKGKE